MRKNTTAQSAVLLGLGAGWRKMPSLVLVPALSLIVMLGGCGGSDSSYNTSTVTARPTVTPTPTLVPTAAAVAIFQAPSGQTFDTHSPVTIPNAGNLSGDSGSVAFELTPGGDEGAGGETSLLDLRTPGRQEDRFAVVVKNGVYLRFLMWDSAGHENGVDYEIENWEAGEPHAVVATWGVDESGHHLMQLFVDGVLVGTHQYDNSFDAPTGQPLVIGNNSPGDSGARSVLNGFQVYNRPLAADRIAQLTYGSPVSATPTPSV